MIKTSSSDIKERLSVAYITAVAARAGCQVAAWPCDKQSIDVMISPVAGDKSQVALQLKATSSEIDAEGGIKFNLPIKNYDDLRDAEAIIPHYLVILRLPEDPAEWLAISAEELAIRGVSYFGNLAGLPSVSNTTSRVVTMPQTQRFDVATLTEMILRSPGRIGTAGS